MKYPKEIKFFNMKVSESDPRVVLSADLILPYSGESTGSAVREHHYSRLLEKLLVSPMYAMHIKRGGKLADFQWYLNIIRSKSTNPHAGYGIGNERVLQYILGVKDIRSCSSFYMLNLESGDFQGAQSDKSIVVKDVEENLFLESESLDKSEDSECIE
jgi:asparaginyl-tRNA synthetase